MTNKVFIATSLDGYIADKEGKIDWSFSIPNPDNIDAGFSEFMEGVDAVIMGRNTFQLVDSFDMEWPYIKPVFVLSNSLSSLPDKYQDKQVEIVSGSIPQVLNTVQQRGHQALYIDGGMTIQSFLKEDLIDEMIITIIPILLGGGTPLFGELSGAQMFDLVESKIFLDVIVQNHYRRKA